MAHLPVVIPLNKDGHIRIVTVPQSMRRSKVEFSKEIKLVISADTHAQLAIGARELGIQPGSFARILIVTALKDRWKEDAQFRSLTGDDPALLVTKGRAVSVRTKLPKKPAKTARMVG